MVQVVVEQEKEDHQAVQVMDVQDQLILVAVVELVVEMEVQVVQVVQE